MSKSLQSCPGRSPAITKSRSTDPHQMGPPKDPAYRDPSAFLEDIPQGELTQTLSLDVAETETRMEALSTDELTLQIARVKRKTCRAAWKQGK